MIEITLERDGTTSVNQIDLGNKYENNDEEIHFTYPEEFADFKKYLIAIYNASTTKTTLVRKYSINVESPPLLVLPINEDKIYVSSSFTYYPGNWDIYVMIRENEINKNESGEYDLSPNEGEHVYVTDAMTGVVNDNKLDKFLLENMPLDTNLKLVYDDLNRLIDEINSKLESGSFNGVGISKIEKTGSDGLVDSYTITFTNDTTFVFSVTNGSNGANGADGVTPNIQIGTVTTLEPDQQATVERTGDNENPVFNFSIPRGKYGKSAYEVAVENSFEGTEEEWLESLRYDHSDEFKQLAEQIKQDAQSSAESATNAVKAVQSAQQTAENAIGAKQTEAVEAITTAKDEAIEEIENTGVPLEDIEKLAIKETATGDPTIISDSADWRLQKLNIYGQSEQDSTTGINLLDYPKKKVIDSEYYDVDEDGYVIQLKADNRANNQVPESVKLPSGVYTASIINGSASSSFQIYNLTDNKMIAYVDTVGNKSRSFTLDKETSISFKIYESTASGILAKARVQINAGNSAKPWEPYTGGKPSPSSDYLQEIKDAEISKIIICNENLLPLDIDADIKSDGIYLYKNLGFTLKKGIRYVLSVKSIVGGLYVVPFGSTSPDTSPFKVYDGDTVECTPTETGKYYFHAYNGSGITDEQKILWLNIGEKKPYTEHVSEQITLSEPIALRGIPVSSGGNVTIDGQRYIADVITEKDGVIGVERNVKEFIFDDSNDWQIYDNRNNHQYSGFIIYSQNVPEEIKHVSFRQNYCNIYPPVVGVYGNNLWITIETNQQHLWAPYNPFFDDLLEDKGLSNWKNYLKENPMTVITYVNNPTFEPLPEEIQAQYKALKNYYPNTVIQTGCWNEVTYVADTKLYIEKKINEVVSTVSNIQNVLIGGQHV